MAPVLEAAGRLVERQLGRRNLEAPTDTQKVTLWVIGAYSVGILIIWNIPYVKKLLWPFTILTIVFHEFGHAFTCMLTCGRVERIVVRADESGETLMRGGITAITLPAGYLGSSLIGAICVCVGFDVSASKVMSFILGAILLMALWWGKRSILTVAICLVAIAAMVGAWFLAHAQVLRFFILFIGVMSSLYSIWDIFDDLVWRKLEKSDAVAFRKRYGGSSRMWGIIWSIISLGFLAAGIVAGVALFPKSWEQQDADSRVFIPT